MVSVPSDWELKRCIYMWKLANIAGLNYGSYTPCTWNDDIPDDMKRIQTYCISADCSTCKLVHGNLIDDGCPFSHLKTDNIRVDKIKRIIEL